MKKRKRIAVILITMIIALIGVRVYIETGNEYEALYAEVHNATGEALPLAEEKMEAFLGRENLPMYQIYRHNCDTVAREMIALIDEETNEFNNSKERLTPSANYKQMYRNFSTVWGSMGLGTDTLIEKILW